MNTKSEHSIKNAVDLSINIYCGSFTGYSLKYRALKKWLNNSGFDDMVVIAQKLKVRVSILKYKLRHHELFNKEQISTLVYFTGAESAFEIIYFPTIIVKRKIYWEVFGKYKQKGNKVE